MISTGSIFAIIMMGVMGMLLPIGVAILWKLKSKDAISTIFIGAAMFALFAIVLESIPKIFLFQLHNPVSNYILNHPLAYAIVGGLLAGIFEETGRFLAFRVFLKKRTWRETAISYGIGHGGFEVIFLLVISSIQYLSYAIMINTGSFDLILQQVGVVAPDQLPALESLPDVLNSLTVGSIMISIWERISAMIFHISCSVMVFYAVNKPKRFWLFPLAILLHASLDLIAGFYQVGWVTNIYVVEVVIFAWAVISFALTYFLLYRSMSAHKNLVVPIEDGLR